jgi:hypothetical protein
MLGIRQHSTWIFQRFRWIRIRYKSASAFSAIQHAYEKSLISTSAIGRNVVVLEVGRISLNSESCISPAFFEFLAKILQHQDF